MTVLCDAHYTSIVTRISESTLDGVVERVETTILVNPRRVSRRPRSEAGTDRLNVQIIVIVGLLEAKIIIRVRVVFSVDGQRIGVIRGQRVKDQLVLDRETNCLRDVCVARLKSELSVAGDVCFRGDLLVAKECIGSSLGICVRRQVVVLSVYVVVPVHLPVPVVVVRVEARVNRDAVAVLGHTVRLDADPDLTVTVFAASHASFVSVQAGGIRI